MKKVIRILGVFIALIIAALILIPVLFKGKIMELVKTQINENVNAVVSFSDVDLSLISNFPDFALGIHDLKVVNKAPFEGQELVSFNELRLSLDLMSVISGEQVVIKEIGLDNANLNVLVDKDGKANYDIAIVDTTEVVEEEVTEGEESAGAFKMALDHYEINHLNLVYDDKSYKTYFSVDDLNHSGNGDFTELLFDLSTSTSIKAINCVYEGVAYVEDLALNLDAKLAMDMDAGKYSFIENELSLNEFKTSIDGYLAMPSDDIDFDLKIEAIDQKFRGLLSLIPSAYAKDMEGIETSGKFSLKTVLKGTMSETTYPGYLVDLNVTDASVHYAELPESITDIQVDLLVDNPTGNDDDVKVELKKFYMLLGKYVVDASLDYKNPITNPHVDMSLKSQIDLAHLKDFMELEQGEEYAGNITANVSASGFLNDLENEEYDKFQAEGEVSILDFLYKAEGMVSTMISSAYFDFTPQSFKLKTMEGQVGNSDFSGNGDIDNILSYALKDEVLSGSFKFHSNSFDLNEWMVEDSTSVASEGTEEIEDTTTYELYEVPTNLDFTMNASIGEILYEGIEMTDAKGTLVINGGRVRFNKAEMKMLGGKIKLNGFYSTEDMANPKTGFYMLIDNFDISETYKTFNSIQKLAPGAEYMSGKFSTEFSFASNLLHNYDLDLNTISGKGGLSSDLVKLKNAPALKKIADKLKYNKLNDIDFNDIDIKFEFKDGKVVVEPFDVKMGDMDLSIEGENGFDQTINYKMVLTMPTAMLGGKASAVVGSFSTELNRISGRQMSIGTHMNFNIVAKGPYDDPKVSVHPSGSHGKPADVVDDIVDMAKDEVTKVVTKAVDDAKKKAIEEAEKQAEKIKADAKKAAAKIRAEGKKQAEAVRKKGYAEANNLVTKAKGPIQKAAAKPASDKLKKETDKKANDIIKKANQEADKVERTAKQKADKLIAEAKKK